MKLIDFLVKRHQIEPKIALSQIKAGKVLVNEEIQTLPHYQLATKDKVRIKRTKVWVSRGALKLLKATEIFKLNFSEKVVLDIGASTGGFTQVALALGAKKVYANDVGTNQLAYSLRINPRVIAMEKLNLKNLKKTNFKEEIDLVVCDVSFISLDRVFDVLNELLVSKTYVMALIKPQFQAPSALVDVKGKVDLKYHKQIIEQVKTYANGKNFIFKQIAPSPIVGKTSQNIEYLSLFQRS